MNSPIIAGGLINAALYLAAVVFASVCAGNHAATVLAIAAIGSATVSYAAQMTEWRSVGVMMAGASWVFGVIAGALLCVGYFA